MNSERRFKFVSTGSILAVLACIAVLGFSFATAQKKAGIVKKLGFGEMNNIIADSVKNAYTNSRDIDAVMMVLDSASQAIDAGDTAAAKQKLSEAKSFLQTVQKSNKQYLEKAPAVNAKCPTCGKAIARTGISADLMRMYKGQKVGFCCEECPADWEQLSDAEKSEKLEKVRPY